MLDEKSRIVPRRLGALMKTSAGYNTKLAIFKALFNLSENKPYESIRVPEICEQAGVSRSTFYHHFNSKFEVVCWHYDMVLALGVNRVGISLNWYNAHLITTTITKQYYDLYSKVRQPNSSDQFFASYYSLKREDALIHAIVDVKKMELTPKLAFQIKGLSHAEEWAIRDWYRGNLEASLQEICEYMVSLVPRELFNALNEPEMPEDKLAVGYLITTLLE